MTRMEWVNLLGLLTVFAGGAFYVGHLDGRLDAINPAEAIEDINAAKDTALEAIERANEGFSDPGSLHSGTFEWKNGEAEVQMISVTEGICYLVAVSGRFQGYGEEVSIYAKGDFWFLGGKSVPTQLSARARCWKFPILETE